MTKKRIVFKLLGRARKNWLHFRSGSQDEVPIVVGLQTSTDAVALRAMADAASKSPDSKSSQRSPIDLDAKPGPVGHANDAFRMLDRLHQKRLANGVLRPIELKQRLDGCE